MRLISGVLFISGTLYVLSPNFLINYASAADNDLDLNLGDLDGLEDGDLGDLDGLEDGDLGDLDGLEDGDLEETEDGDLGNSDGEGDESKDSEVDEAKDSEGDETKDSEGDDGNASEVKEEGEEDPTTETQDEKASEVQTPSPSQSQEAPVAKPVKKTSGPKEKDWNSWMKKVKKDFSGYKGSMRTERHNWVSEKLSELDKFLLYLEKRWCRYTGNIDKDCRSDFLKSAKQWSDGEWGKWVNGEGKRHMNKQFQKWLDYNKFKLNDWTNTEWTKWKSEKKDELDDEEWKKKEVSGKTKDWLKYTDKMEKKCLKKTQKVCKNWEKDAYHRYKKWEKDFAKKWSSNRQWNTWTKELEN
ncbi:tryptophan-rich antigen, putative [Plasmodium ovale wallikeri]|uniref:Tryptophan-rich antigen, putative n=2 Tax=Plasmodium ovale TaxID=36330 RepID=A0A1A9AN09_PLAOA|nr:tryptophan-rich antigen, putative [Plasmodium ovale wallikeri]SBT57606.1 tryptophan-rich antigen, putative [Plasmodium ovale wallikeri]SBT75769.1 tryptophan-rich protein [Plasmodium ovale]